MTVKNNYQRIFAFGCSFTHYKWPTWADLMALDRTDCYYNFGLSGMGNLGIMSRLTEAHHRYQFGPDDLVMIMWTTYSREDRWLNDRWYAVGNVWGEHEPYPKDWVKNYADPLGYMIRDHAIIAQTAQWLNGLACDQLVLRSVPFEYSDGPGQAILNPEKFFQTISDLNRLYAGSYNQLPQSLWDYLGRDWARDPISYQDQQGIRTDCHPRPLTYWHYLTAQGLETCEAAEAWAQQAEHTIAACTTDADITEQAGSLINSRLKPRTDQLF